MQLSHTKYEKYGNYIYKVKENMKVQKLINNAIKKTWWHALQLTVYGLMYKVYATNTFICDARFKVLTTNMSSDCELLSLLQSYRLLQMSVRNMLPQSSVLK